MDSVRIQTTGFALLLVAASAAPGAPQQQSSVASSGGTWCSNGTHRTAYTAGQPGAVGVTVGAQYTHYAGFMGGAFIRPGETSHEGMPVEADPDNDDDGLTDAGEVSGAAFGGHASTDPNSPDSDEDGMDDGAEAAGMYDPNDRGHALRILTLDRGPGNAVGMSWIGKGGGTVNTILWCHDLRQGSPSNTLHSDAYAGGSAPWHKVTNTHAWVESAPSNRYFRVTTGP